MSRQLKLELNSATAPKEANVKSVCKSLKKKLQEKHPELNVENELVTINNGFQIKCSDWTFDIVRYQKWLRLDILRTGEKQAKFYKTDAPEVRDVVTLFMAKIDDALAKEPAEQPTAEAEPAKTVTPLQWISETGMNGTSGFYACLGDKRLAHISTCGMIYWMTDDVTTLDRSKINAKASRVYHEWMNGYATASDEEKENTYIRPNLTTADSFDMSRDFKKVELRERQPERYKNYPTRAEWLNTWKHEMFELLKQDGYKYPSDVSTNSNRKGERIMKTLRFNSAKVERAPGEPNPYYPDSELALPVTTEEVAQALTESISHDPDTALLIIHAPESENPKDPRLIYVRAAGYEDNALIADGDGSANVYVNFLDNDYNSTPLKEMKLFEVVDYIEATVKTPVNSSRKTYLRRKLDALNSAKLPVGATSKSEVDNEFLNDVDSILSLSTGDTIDVDAAYLAYNPETKELILSDESETTLDSGFVIIGEFTPDNDALAKIAGKEPELEPDETDDDFADDEMPADESEEMPERDPHVPAPEDEGTESEGGIF